MGQIFASRSEIKMPAAPIYAVFPLPFAVGNFDEVRMPAARVVVLDAVAHHAFDCFVECGCGPAAGCWIGAGEEAAPDPLGEGLEGEAQMCGGFRTVERVVAAATIGGFTIELK
jgi:hypothetical protein